MEPDLGLPGNVWPWHPRPFHDELLSSYLMRLAHGYQITPHYLARRLVGHRAIWNRDLDKLAPPELLQAISKKLSLSYEEVNDMSLRSLSGRVLSKFSPNGNSKHILSLKVYHRLRKRPGLQYCPQCLAAKNRIYFRRSWRLAFITVCTTHKRILRDCCPTCGSPVNIHRQQNLELNISHCYQCNESLTLKQSKREKIDEEHPLLALQKRIEHAVATGQIGLSDAETVPLAEYLDVFRQLARRASTRAINQNELAAFQKGLKLNLAPIQGSPGTQIEHYTIRQRFEAFKAAAQMMNNWPESLISFCYKTRTWSTALTRDFHSAPDWFLKPVTEKLDGNRLRNAIAS